MSQPQTPPLLNSLTTLEQKVIDAARHGHWVQPDTVGSLAENKASAGTSQRVRAELLRELLMGRHGDLDPRGLRIRAVQVGGQLDLDHVTAVTGLTLTECALPQGVTCVDARLREVNLGGSRISGLNADGLHTENDMILRDTTIAGRDAVRLRGAHIDGRLDLDHTEIINIEGAALLADGLRVEGNMFMRDATIAGVGRQGAVRLTGVHIGGQFELDRTAITNTTGPALDADNLQTGNGMFLRHTTLAGTGKLGTLRVLGAHIGGPLELDHAEITNTTTGPALVADNLQTGNGMLLPHATLTGTGEPGTLRLAGAHIGGQLLVNGIRVNNQSGLLMDLTEVQVTAALSLPTSVVCPHSYAEMDQSGCPDGARRIAADGLTFPRLAALTWQQWLHLLTHHTPTYRPQPFQQLAAVERAAGHDTNARQVLIAQQEDVYRRAPEALGGRLAQVRHRLWGWLGCYGYRAHRLVIALALALTLAAALGYVAGQISTRPGHHAAERVSSPTTASTTSPGTPCSTAELIGLGIDRGLPLGATGLRTRCDLDTATRRGQAFTYTIWTLQALIWGLATLAVAAYTGLVRKPT